MQEGKTYVAGESFGQSANLALCPGEEAVTREYIARGRSSRLATRTGAQPTHGQDRKAGRIAVVSRVLPFIVAAEMVIESPHPHTQR